MYALTIWQPWADAIARGSKRVENRPWSAPPVAIGQIIAIHAGQKLDHDAELPSGETWPHPVIPPTWLPRGAIIAVATLTGCHPYSQPGCLSRPCSPWAAWGQFHWQLDQVQAMPCPIPARGFQRLWHLNPGLERVVAESWPDNRP
jgi:ASCH domain